MSLSNILIEYLIKYLSSDIECTKEVYCDEEVYRDEVIAHKYNSYNSYESKLIEIMLGNMNYIKKSNILPEDIMNIILDYLEFVHLQTEPNPKEIKFNYFAIKLGGDDNISRIGIKFMYTNYVITLEYFIENPRFITIDYQYNTPKNKYIYSEGHFSAHYFVVYNDKKNNKKNDKKYELMDIKYMTNYIEKYINNQMKIWHGACDTGYYFITLEDDANIVFIHNIKFKEQIFSLKKMNVMYRETLDYIIHEFSKLIDYMIKNISLGNIAHINKQI